MAKALPLSSSGALRTGGKNFDSADTSGEYALAEPGKPRCERPYENGTVLVDSGAAEAST